MKHILLVDDDARDVELTLAALEENHLANKVTVAKNGEVAFDFSEFIRAVRQIDLFWAAVEQPPSLLSLDHSD